MSTIETFTEAELRAPVLDQGKALRIIDQLTADHDEWRQVSRDWRARAEAAERRLREAGTSVHDTRTFPALSAEATRQYDRAESAERTKQHLLWAIDRANSEEDLARQAEAFERARAEAAEREVARLTTQVQDLEARIAKALEWTDCESLNAEAMAYHVAEELRGIK